MRENEDNINDDEEAINKKSQVKTKDRGSIVAHLWGLKLAHFVKCMNNLLNF